MRTLSMVVVIGACALGAQVARAPQSAPPRIKVEAHADAARNGTAIVTNLSPVVLDAYLLEVILEPCSPMQPRSTWRAVDTLISVGVEPLREKESRSEALGSSPCNKVGPPTPNRAELKAAIFHDGSTSGDAVSTGMLLDSRRTVLAQIETVLTRLKAPDAAGVSAGILTADLRARATAAGDARPPFPPLADVAALVASEIDKAPGARADQVARAVRTLEAWRQRLLDSRPALR